MKAPTFRLTLAAAVVAASLPASNALAQQSESCTRLMAMIEETGDAFREEFADARTVAEADDADECAVYVARVDSVGGMRVTDEAAAQTTQTEETTETVEIEREATIEGEVEVTMPDPEVMVEQDPADISVRTPPPEVSVSQGQPTIVIRQAQPIIRVQMAQPTITVEQPAPEIVVTMPEPGVDIATAEPVIEVNIPEPRVTVRQGDPRLSVNLDTNVGETAETDSSTRLERSDEDGVMVVRADGLSGGAVEPNIRYVENEEAPRIDISGAEPQVDYVAAEPEVVFESAGEPSIELVDGGEPKIMIRRAGEDEEAALESGEAGTTAMAAVDTSQGEAAEGQRDPREAFAAGDDASLDAADPQVITVDELDGMDVVNARGEELGEVGRVVRNGNDTYVIVEHGGWFFGMNDKEVAFPAADMTVRDDQVVLRGLSEEQIEAMPDYDYANEVALEAGDEITLKRVN